jgi:hypothetical protein
MFRLVDFPLVVLVLSLVLFWLAAVAGLALSKRHQLLKAEGVRDDYNTVLGATLTFLGLLVGFTFSMAVNRYDQRKNYEAEEANAIGTEYVRADLLPGSGATQVHALLRDYVDQRILFYTTRDSEGLHEVGLQTAKLQDDLWSAVTASSSTQPNPVVALAVAGMNDVLNSQGYTQAAWWNRIPTAAWVLIVAIAVFANLLVGYGARGDKSERLLGTFIPAIIATSFFLIADIDSPRRGIIHVKPQNLISLAESLRQTSEGH